MSSNQNRLKTKSSFKTILTGTFSYSTTRTATIHSQPVNFIFRISQLLILSYIIG